VRVCQVCTPVASTSALASSKSRRPGTLWLGSAYLSHESGHTASYVPYGEDADIPIVRTACVRMAACLVDAERLLRMHAWQMRTKA